MARRQILRSPGPMASQVAKMFNPRNSAAYSSDSRGNTPRKNARILSKKKQFSKAVKVLFISDVELPAPFSRPLVLSEGMFILNSFDDEMTIKRSLTEILKKTRGSVLGYDLIFISFGDKKLSLPCVQDDFEWNGDNLKANIGQGKLYVMVCSRSSQSNSLAEIQSLDSTDSTVPSADGSSRMEDDTYLPDIPSSNDDQQVNSGMEEEIDTRTPTVRIYKSIK